MEFDGGAVRGNVFTMMSIPRHSPNRNSAAVQKVKNMLTNLGFQLSDQAVCGHILRRHGFSPALKRKRAICWKDFIRQQSSLQFQAARLLRLVPDEAHRATAVSANS
jgi:hypothetical protein